MEDRVETVLIMVALLVTGFSIGALIGHSINVDETKQLRIEIHETEKLHGAMSDIVLGAHLAVGIYGHTMNQDTKPIRNKILSKMHFNLKIIEAYQKALEKRLEEAKDENRRNKHW